METVEQARTCANRFMEAFRSRPLTSELRAELVYSSPEECCNSARLDMYRLAEMARLPSCNRFEDDVFKPFEKD